MSTRRKCVICGNRPVAKGQQAGYCKVCQDQIDSGRRARSSQEEVRQYVTYKGVVIALKPSHVEGGLQMYKAERIFRAPESLPKSKLVDLNHYVEGLDRKQVKKYKALFARVAA